MPLFRGDEKHVETFVVGFLEKIVTGADGTRQFVVGFQEFPTVQPVHDVVRQAEHPSGQVLLQFENVELHDAFHRLSVVLVVLHDFSVAVYAERFVIVEVAADESLEFVYGVLSQMPRIARERHLLVGSRDYQFAARSEYPPDFVYCTEVVPDVFDDLKTEDEIHAARLYSL